MNPTEALREIWYESAGSRLFAVECGEGAPIIFLHGGLADHRASLSRMAALSAGYRLITPDLRGAGRSHYTGELSWELLADDIASLLRALGIERAVIGGTSAGSAAALKFALRYERETSALLLAAPVYPGTERGLPEAAALALQRMDAAAQRALVAGIDALEPLFAALPDAIRAGALAMVRSFDPGSVAATTRFLASGRQPFTQCSELTRLTTPTLIIAGSDPEHPVEVAELYAEALPNAVLSAAGDPVESILSFLGRQSGRTDSLSSSP